MSEDKSNKTIQNGYDADSLNEIPPVMEVKPTLRARIWELLLFAGLAIFFAYLINLIPPYGTYLDRLLGFKMNLLHIKISYGVLAWPLRIATLGSFAYGVYIVLQQKMTTYQLNDRNIIYTRGVFVRESDSTDLVAVRDHKLISTIHDRILGLSRLIILSKDLTDPEMPIIGIEAKEAQQIINFLRKYAFQNYTEWRLAQERQRRRQNNVRRQDVIDDLPPGAFNNGDDDSNN